MNKLTAIFVASIASLAVATTAAQAVDYTFKTEKDAKDFKPYGAKWQVKDKAYGPAAGPALFSPTLVQGKKFKKVSAQASIKKLEPSTLAGVMARAKVNGALLYGYFGGVSNSNGTIYAARLFKFNGYNIKTTQGSNIPLCQAIVPTSKKKNVELRASGSSLQLYVNGDLLCSATDTTFANGQVGLLASPLPGGKTVSSFSSASFED